MLKTFFIGNKNDVLSRLIEITSAESFVTKKTLNVRHPLAQLARRFDEVITAYIVDSLTWTSYGFGPPHLEIIRGGCLL